jgi:hypothetical protein
MPQSGHFCPQIPTKFGGSIMDAQSPSVPIPSGSPLATGWRAMVAALLEQHGVAELLDVLAAYAELRCLHEPDNCSAAEEAAQGGWYRIADPAVRRIKAKAELLAAEKRALPRLPHPTRIRSR